MWQFDWEIFSIFADETSLNGTEMESNPSDGLAMAEKTCSPSEFSVSLKVSVVLSAKTRAMELDSCSSKDSRTRGMEVPSLL